ncbi:DUF296 domain-containing protein [Vibrio cidicii]|uniref:PPC domain-containing DNA-binding protein n=1 Tax=Vibrio cidicii TaxID=1763883 RepID=UPI0029BD05D9|nr:DUF296 domain-containing protein [Vibrio cidicii]
MAINILVTRLTRGDDLKKVLAEIVTQHSISAGSIASCVGSLSALNIRLAGAEQTLSLEAPFELVSLMGTLTAKHQHVHIAVSDTQGRVWGGHLLEGCLIDTTAELIIHHYPDLVFQRAFDEQTGFSELVVD